MAITFKEAEYTVTAVGGLSAAHARTFAVNAAALPLQTRSGVKPRLAVVRRQLKMICPQAAVDARANGWSASEVSEFNGLAIV